MADSKASRGNDPPKPPTANAAPSGGQPRDEDNIEEWVPNEKFNFPYLDVSLISSLPNKVQNAFASDLSSYYKVLPLSVYKNTLTLAVFNPIDVLKFDDIRIITSKKINFVLCEKAKILAAIDRLFDNSGL